MDTLRRLANKVGSLLFKAVIASVNDQARLQLIQIIGRQNEVITVTRYQDYGFSSVPQPAPSSGEGAEVLVATPEPGHRAIIASDDRRYRPRSQPSGDSMMYSDLDAVTGPDGRPIGSDARPEEANARRQLTRDPADGSVPWSVDIVRNQATGAFTRVVEKPGEYSIVLRDENGNEATLTLTPQLMAWSSDLIDNTAGGNALKIRDMREVFDIHVHPENDSGGPTNTPNQKQGPS